MTKLHTGIDTPATFYSCEDFKTKKCQCPMLYWKERIIFKKNMFKQHVLPSINNFHNTITIKQCDTASE